MLTKAATHFRPLLRLPSHPTPDLFTSNPSLLHHLPSQGVGNTLVAQAQSTAQAASGSSGATGGAGRSSYQGATGGGGYTGHARAFLSLPQNPSADASSVAGGSDDKQDIQSVPRHLVLKQRLATTRVVEETQSLSVRERLSVRTGSRAVAFIEIDPSVPVDEGLAHKRRSSIAYPSWQALPSSDSASSGRPLWDTIGASPRPALGARLMSTQASTLALSDINDTQHLVSRSPAPETHRLGQPNRVLMDLAGLDFARPATRLGQVRRNSTASIVRPVLDSDDLPFTGKQSEDADLRIWNAINEALRDRNANRAAALTAHYRTSRAANLPTPVGDASLAGTFPLPKGYSVATYNICLKSVLLKHKRGDSIAPILDMYNEMLQRDIVPNVRTYEVVIRALCLREIDVAAASARWARERDWSSFKHERLGIAPFDPEAEAIARADIEAFQSEENASSALKLFNVASSFYQGRYTFPSAIYTAMLQVLKAASTLPHPPPAETILSIFRAANNDYTLYATVFEALATKGPSQLETIQTLWSSFEETAVKVRSSLEERTAKNEETGERERGRALSVYRDTCVAAVRAFVGAGDSEFAISIVESKIDSGLFDSTRHLVSALVSSLAQVGDFDNALKWMRRGTFINAPDAYILAEALVKGGRVSDAVAVTRAIAEELFDNVPGYRIDRNVVHRIYCATLAEAIAAGDETTANAALDAAASLLATIAPYYDPLVVAKHIELLVTHKRFPDVGRTLHAFSSNQSNPSSPAIRLALCELVSSPVPLATLLDALRGLARLGEPVSTPADHIPIPTLVIDKYLATRATVASPLDLHLSQDAWFRLLEAFIAVPTAHLESGAADAAFETFLSDLALFRDTRFPLPNGFSTSPCIAELANILAARFGWDRASILLTGAFGDKAAAVLPTPEGTPASSQQTFTLPPTPTSSDSVSPVGPQSASTPKLRISSKLEAMIDKLSLPNPPKTPLDIYAHVRSAISEENAVPSPDAIGRLIAAIARTGDEPKARELYSLAQVVLASCVTDPVAQAEGWRTVEDGMIAACCFLGHLEQAGIHRARIIDAGMAPSADAYATMIASSRDSTDDALVARELFDESQALGVVPHLYLFNTIISKLSKARKAEMALELFGQMKSAGIRPSSVTYGAVINACCRVGDAESAAALFEEMSAMPNFKPRVPPYNTMMQFHLQTRPSRERILYYYDAMRAAGVRPSAHTYKLLLDTFGTLAPVDLAAMERVFADLCADRHVPVQGTHWASLITAYGIHADEVDRALAIFDQIPSHPSSRPGAAPEPVVWEAALNVVGQRGSLAQMDAIRARMVEAGARSTAYVCNVLIAGYSHHGELNRARQVFESMTDSVTGVAAPNNHPALLTSSGHVKPATMTTEPTDLIYREPSTYEAMVRAELAAGNREAAEAILTRMEERRYPVAVWMKARAILDESV